MNIGDLLDSSYVAMDILYRQQNQISRAVKTMSSIERQTDYSTTIMNNMKSGWRWIMRWFQTPPTPLEPEPVKESLPPLQNILDIQKAISLTLDNQMSSLIVLENNTDKIINKMADNSASILRM